MDRIINSVRTCVQRLGPAGALLLVPIAYAILIWIKVFDADEIER